MGAQRESEAPPRNVRSVAEIEALPASTESILVERLDDAKARALGHLRQLRILYQDGSPSGLTDDGVGALGQLPLLEVLDLEWADAITDRGLAALHQVPGLRWIDILGCSGLSQEAINALRRAKPDLHIDGAAV